MHTTGDGRFGAAGNGGARRTRRTTLWGAVALTLGLTFGGLSVPAASTADTSPAPGTPETVAADGLPTVQIDGVVYAQEVVGNTVYVGGSFTKARPAGAAPGTNETPRANLLAYDLTTGELIASWNPGANNTVLDIKKSADGTRIYVAGMFSKAGGAWRYRVAAFDTATGALVTNWAPEANGRIDGLAVTESAVYLAGEFTTINGTQRTKVAAVSTTTGAVTGFTANVQGGYGAKAVVVSPDRSKVVVSGSFTSVNGSTNPGRGITALNASTGAIMPWAMNSTLFNSGTAAAMYSLTSDGDSVYGTGFSHGSSLETRFEGAYRADWSDGSLIWMEDCHGDTYDVAVAQDAVYIAGHPHDCSTIGGFPDSSTRFQNSLAFAKTPSDRRITSTTFYRDFTGQRTTEMLHWFPSYVPGTYTGLSQGPWQTMAHGDYLLVGGEFLKVNGVAQQGIVRFAKKNVAPNKQGPQEQGSAWKLSTLAVRAGNKLTWNANYDRDSQKLTYQVFRQDKGMTTPLTEMTATSNFWTRPAMSFIDATAIPGASYNYRIKAIDGSGNSTQTDWTPVVTAASTGTSNSYDRAVLAGKPTAYWPLNEGGAAAGLNWVSANDLVMSNASLGTTGPLASTPTSKSTAFTGADTSGGGSKNSVSAPQVFTIEAWFKTASKTGGAIVGFNAAQNGKAGTHDRDVYLDNTGRVTFGVWKGSQQTITSTPGFNDDTWHHVVASVSSTGQTLYVDGVQIGSKPTVTTADAYTGHWRVGGSMTTAWANAGSSSFLKGAVSNVAIYDRGLSASEIAAHRQAGLLTPTATPAPTAYDDAVLTAAPVSYWPLNESSGNAGFDRAGSNHLIVDNGTRGSTGPVTTSSAPTTTFAGTAGSGARTLTSAPAPQVFSIEAWFKTDSTSGGKIIGFGDAATRDSVSNDRNVYIDGAGRVSFGVYPGETRAIGGGANFNDDRWHHVVATLSPSGQKLYVDGVEIAASLDTTSAHPYSGYWRIGGDTIGGWPNAGTSPYLKGAISNVAIYDRVLTPSEMASHRKIALGVLNQAPVAAFTPTATGLSVAVDGSASADPDGTIASYAWNFGDNGTATGATASHTYTTAGTYQVTLTVTDDKGATNTVTKPVTVTAPPANAPLVTDTFTRTVPSGGWGTADLGGAWTLQGGAAAYSVNGTGGVVSMAPSQTRTARLGLSGTDAVVRVSVAADQVATGGAATATVIGRQVAGSNYSARVRFEVGGGVRLYLLRDETALGSYLMPGVTYTPGTVLNVALSVTGTNPTTLSAKVWKATDAEPATWQVTATDTTAAMQTAGTVGLMNTVSGASTLPATVFTWDDLTITKP